MNKESFNRPDSPEKGESSLERGPFRKRGLFVAGLIVSLATALYGLKRESRSDTESVGESLPTRPTAEAVDHGESGARGTESDQKISSEDRERAEMDARWEYLRKSEERSEILRGWLEKHSGSVQDINEDAERKRMEEVVDQWEKDRPEMVAGLEEAERVVGEIQRDRQREKKMPFSAETLDAVGRSLRETLEREESKRKKLEEEAWSVGRELDAMFDKSPGYATFEEKALERKYEALKKALDNYPDDHPEYKRALKEYRDFQTYCASLDLKGSIQRMDKLTQEFRGK